MKKETRKEKRKIGKREREGGQKERRLEKGTEGRRV